MTDMNETNLSHALPGQERYVAPLEETPLKDVDSVDESVPASSLWADAWRTLRKNPMFIISAVLIVFIIFVALFPGVMTKQNPNYCTLENSLNRLRRDILSDSICKDATCTPAWCMVLVPR